MKATRAKLTHSQLATQIYTFDEYGVSGHVNHIATYQGVQLGLMQLRGNYPTQSHSITCYKLNSKNIFRKFLGILDIFITCVWDDSTTSAVTEYNLNPFLPLNALQLHYSQFYLYRILFIFLSCFTYINSFIKM